VVQRRYRRYRGCTDIRPWLKGSDALKLRARRRPTRPPRWLGAMHPRYLRIGAKVAKLARVAEAAREQ
jgi:hypothetical protein